MRGQIIYIEGHPHSGKQSKNSKNSWVEHGWEMERVPGITPNTLDEAEFPWGDMLRGRLFEIGNNEPWKYYIKKSCLFNNLRFARKVLEEGEAMVFAEHDSLCIGPPQWYHKNVQDFCFLAMEHAFTPRPNNQLGNRGFKYYSPFVGTGLHPFPEDFPLKYYKRTGYFGAKMCPGTVAYILTPSGAEKILAAAEKNGLEQSDFIYNTNNLNMEFDWPSQVNYMENLNTSHGDKKYHKVIQEKRPDAVARKYNPVT